MDGGSRKVEKRETKQRDSARDAFEGELKRCEGGRCRGGGGGGGGGGVAAARGMMRCRMYVVNFSSVCVSPPPLSTASQQAEAEPLGGVAVCKS